MHGTIKKFSAMAIASIVSTALASGTPSFAQSVADAARQERERKNELRRHAIHVYTNEDLSKPHILVPEDEARVVVGEKEGAGPARATTAVATPPDGEPAPPQVSQTEPAVDAVVPNSATVLIPAGNPSAATPRIVQRPSQDNPAPKVADTLADPAMGSIAARSTPSGANIQPSITKPLAKAANYGTNEQGTVSIEIPLPSTTMPFATSVMGYGMANLVAEPPAAPIASRGNASASLDLPAPDVTPVVAPAPVVLGGYSVSKPAEPAKDVPEEKCADCVEKVRAVDSSEAIATFEHPAISAEPAKLGISTSVPQQLPAGETTGMVKIQPGDSLWKLAARYFGNGSLWRKLAKLNPQLMNPSRIRVGEFIRVPSERKQNARQIIVQPGDSLWKIAENDLGDASALSCIVLANPQLHSIDLVHAGDTVIVPSGCEAQDNARN